MPYTFQISANQCYILAVVEGDINNQLAKEQTIKMHELGKKMGISRFLVDMTASRFKGTPLHHYEFAYKEMPAITVINRFARIAILVEASDHSHDFIETVARNNGLDITMFRERKEAIDHLERD